MLSIGVIVRRMKGSEVLTQPDEYSAFLIGELQLHTIHSARAEVRMGSGKKPLLTTFLLISAQNRDIDRPTKPLSADGQVSIQSVLKEPRM